MNEVRQRVIDYALAQVDKPYAVQGWGPHAWDCIGLAATSGIEAGVFDYSLKDEEDWDLRHYPSDPHPKMLRRALNKYFIRLKKNEVLPGDFLWFRDPKAQHLGVVTKINPFYCVHAQLNTWKVRHQRVAESAYIICGWRYPGMIDGK